MSSEWKPIRFDKRWVVYRTLDDGSMERSEELFANRSSALVVASTLNSQQAKIEERVRKRVARSIKLWAVGKNKDDDDADTL